jgi:hypothetical protein
MEGTDHPVITWRKSTHSGGNGGNCVEVGTWRKSTYSGGNGSDCVEVGTWRKSTHSGGNGSNCVEVGTWRKSTHSGDNGGDCVEVGGASAVPAVLVRDTKDRAGAALAFGPDAWRRFAAALRDADRA